MAKKIDTGAYKSFTNEQLADVYGSLKAKIAPDMEKLETLKAAFAERGFGDYRGSLWDVVVFPQERSSLDMEAVKKKLSPQFIRANTRTTTSTVVKATAKKLAIAA